MTKVLWDQTGERVYETGVDRGVLYIPNGSGVYNNGYGWNGLTAVTESPSGAEPTDMYANNSLYVTMRSAEKFGCTIEAYTYPDEFEQCDGSATPQVGVTVSQQARKPFGLSWRTKLGNDTQGDEFGYKIHLAYGCTAAPSEKARTTVNDSPEMVTFSWEATSVPVAVTGLRPSAKLTIDSTKVDATALAALEDLLYGTVGTDPSLPLPDAVLALFDGTVVEVTPTEPTYNGTTHVITIPSITGVTYKIDGVTVTGTVTLTTGQTKIVKAYPNAGYSFPAVIDDDWLFTY